MVVNRGVNLKVSKRKRKHEVFDNSVICTRKEDKDVRIAKIERLLGIKIMNEKHLANVLRRYQDRREKGLI